MATLHRFGFANQPRSEHREDGLALRDVYITATLRCAPPDNRPLSSEIVACRTFLLQELHLLKSVSVMVALGRIAFEGALSAISETHPLSMLPRPAFGHGRSYSLSNGLTLLASYHPSQQNTQTGRLTQKMFDAVFARAKDILAAGGV
jgi:uracil-DNA glycosylase family 4